MSLDKRRSQPPPIRVVISGGGTAGHIYPALAVAHALQQPVVPQPAPTDRPADGSDLSGQRDEPGQPGSISAASPPLPAGRSVAAPAELRPGTRTSATAPVELLYLHGPSRRDDEVMAHAGIPHRRLDVGPIRGAAPHKLLLNTARLGRAVMQAMGAMGGFHADVVMATGGYVSAPSIIAGWLMRVPVVLYLPDASPGLAVRVLAPFAKRIALSFPLTKQYFKTSKAIVTGYPVRPEFLTVDRETARQAYDLRPDLPVVMVMGGSTGAHSLNLAVSDALEPLLHHTQLIHLCGEQDEQMLREQRAKLDAELRQRYHLFRYLHRGVAEAMAACDLMVCRAGASALAELPILGIPAVLVPGTFAGGHQEKNADFLVQEGAARKVPDVQLSQGALMPAVLSLLEDRKQLASMAAQMRRLARPEAANNIAALIRSVARRH